jgi:DNA repair exonuclease SbcCD ATPase subunit
MTAVNVSSYRRDLQTKKQELARLLRQRQEIDHKIAQLQPLISHLEGLCKELGDRAAKEAATKVELTTGLTELARITLEEVGLPLNASQLKTRMETKGFDFSKYTSPLATLHTILTRLVKSGRVRVVPEKGGKRSYQWVTTIDNLLSLLQAVNKVAQHSQPKDPGKPGARNEATGRPGTVTPPKR